MKELKNIYHRLQDKESRFLFENRLLYSITNDHTYIKKIIESLPQKRLLDDRIACCRQQIWQTVFYGAGNDLLLLSELYPDLRIQNICDRDVQKQQEGWHSIPVMSPERLLEMRDKVYVAITTSGSYEEIRRFLSCNGFKKEQIVDLSMVTDTKQQYFEPGIMSPCPDEVFIDGGCFDGSTARTFIQWCSGDFKRIYAFEPDKKNYERCLEMCERGQVSDIELYQRGLWDSETQLTFLETGGQGSLIKEGSVEGREKPGAVMEIPAADGLDVIRTAAVDAVVGEDKVTFIKLDVEGAELKALQGAELSIRRHRPRLAVSIYHKPEDVVEIPAYILSLHEDYRLYIRHYQMSACETILYAV